MGDHETWYFYKPNSRSDSLALPVIFKDSWQQFKRCWVDPKLNQKEAFCEVIKRLWTSAINQAKVPNYSLLSLTKKIQHRQLLKEPTSDIKCFQSKWIHYKWNIVHNRAWKTTQQTGNWKYPFKKLKERTNSFLQINKY